MGRVSAVVVGAGSRGKGYSYIALESPDQLKIVGVAEPNPIRRQKIQDLHKLPHSAVFETWEEFVALEKIADCVFICTLDRFHKAPAVACAKKGYHILLEKPMAVTYADCKEIVEACKENNVMLAVCHVLRYSPQARKIKAIIESGTIGDVLNIQHLEPVGYWHYAHSYVRGNWRNVETSTFSLLAKCCHDIDLIEFWMGNKKCQSISSMGSLKHFTKENKPKGAASRCLECSVEADCQFSAVKIYINPVKQGHAGFAIVAATDIVDIENITEAIRTGPYGRCVYECDNDVMDNQVVTMQYEGGATCSVSMVACTEKLCGRQTRIFGTKGELSCDFDTTIIRQFTFLTKNAVRHDVRKDIAAIGGSAVGGHGGSDFFTIHSFLAAIVANDPTQILTGPDESLQSHFLCFAAEKARLEKSVIDVSVPQNIRFE